MKYLNSFLRTVARGLIRFYQIAISPFLGQNCRFNPTCSHYALQAFETYNPLTATKLTVKRIARCHPWSSGGYDPVPQQCDHDLSTDTRE